MEIRTQEVKVKTTTTVVYQTLVLVQGKELIIELSNKPTNDEVFVLEGEDAFVVGYLVQDKYYEDDECDRDWKIVTTHRHAKREDHRAYQLARGMDEDFNFDPELKPNPYAVLLDIYEHSGRVYSISGEGYQCQWDTARGGGIWIPNDAFIQELKEQDFQAEDERSYCIKNARWACEHLNCLESGDVWGIACEKFNLNGHHITGDACWGFVGSEYAKEELQSEMKGIL